MNPETQHSRTSSTWCSSSITCLEFVGQKPDYSEEKWLGIIRKTWEKMSGDARAFALSGKLELPEPLVPLITKAIAGA